MELTYKGLLLGKGFQVSVLKKQATWWVLGPLSSYSSEVSSGPRVP